MAAAEVADHRLDGGALALILVAHHVGEDLLLRLGE
jgi:hypothetical protein